MSASSRYLAFFSYLLSLPAALYVLFARRTDVFAVFHARQSLFIGLVGVIAPLVWALVAWVLAWIPTVGSMLSICLFALLLAIYVVLAVDSIIGMVYSLRGQVRRTPLAGPFANRRPPAAPTPPKETSETPAELLEPTTTSDL